MIPMRTPFVLAMLVLAAALPAVASAHLSHSWCTSTTLRPASNAVHVDSFTGACRGLVVSSPLIACDGGLDLHVLNGVHVLVLYDSGCQTGVVVEVLLLDAAPAPLLP